MFESKTWYKEVTILTIIPFIVNIAVFAATAFVSDALVFVIL